MKASPDDKGKGPEVQRIIITPPFELGLAEDEDIVDLATTAGERVVIAPEDELVFRFGREQAFGLFEALRRILIRIKEREKLRPPKIIIPGKTEVRDA